MARSAAVDEEEIIVLNASIYEALSTVQLLVQPDDGRYVVARKIRKVRFRSVQRVACDGKQILNFVSMPDLSLGRQFGTRF